MNTGWISGLRATATPDLGLRSKSSKAQSLDFPVRDEAVRFMERQGGRATYGRSRYGTETEVVMTTTLSMDPARNRTSGKATA